MTQSRNILILHGWNLSGARFDLLVSEFKKHGFTVWVPDLPGFGTEPMQETSLCLSDYVEFTRNYIQSRKIKKPVIVGHSFGGRIGIKLAAHYPGEIYALILSGAPGINPVGSLKIRFFRILAKTGNVIFSLPLLSLMEESFRRILYTLARSGDYYKTAPFMRETLKRIVGEDISQLLPALALPTLLIWGKDDRIVPVEIAGRMAVAMPHAQLVVIDGARHGVPWTHATDFVKTVSSFVTKI